VSFRKVRHEKLREKFALKFEHVEIVSAFLVAVPLDLQKQISHAIGKSFLGIAYEVEQLSRALKETLGSLHAVVEGHVAIGQILDGHISRIVNVHGFLQRNSVPRYFSEPLIHPQDAIFEVITHLRERLKARVLEPTRAWKSGPFAAG
jgi:hypothetical protein